MPGFAADVHKFRHAGLHAKSHFVLADARGDFRIIHHLIPRPIQSVDCGYQPALVRFGNSRRRREIGRLESCSAKIRCVARGNGLPLPKEVSATNPGRFSLSLPKPYQSQDTMLGRPEIEVPVLRKVCAGSWLICSV